jgi:hypothetical protein
MQAAASKSGERGDSDQLMESPSAACTATVDAMRIRSNRASDERAPQPPETPQTDNNLGTGLGDRCRAPQGHSGRLEAHVEEGRKGT